MIQPKHSVIPFWLVLIIILISGLSCGTLAKKRAGNDIVMLESRVQILGLQLRVSYLEAFKNYSLTEEVQTQMNQIIDKGMVALQEDPTQKNAALIQQNFDVLTGEIKKAAVKIADNPESFQININSINTALKICPLYPFC